MSRNTITNKINKSICKFPTNQKWSIYDTPGLDLADKNSRRDIDFM